VTMNSSQKLNGQLVNILMQTAVLVAINERTQYEDTIDTYSKLKFINLQESVYLKVPI